MKRIRRLLRQPERPTAAWTPAISAGLLVVSAGIAFASWQSSSAQTPQAPLPAVTPAPVAPAAFEPSRAPVRKPARVLLAQAPQAAQTVEQQLKDLLQRESTAPQEMTTPTTSPQQSAPPSQSETNARPMTEKQRKAKEKKAREELATPYKKWLNEDVAYIITDEERAAFKQANNDEEREQFIEQFWLRRDPTPGHARKTSLRKSTTAASHMPMSIIAPLSGIPAGKPIAARIYITFGPPDEIEDHSSGGSYQRPPEEGGGETSTFPFQQWRYTAISTALATTSSSSSSTLPYTKRISYDQRSVGKGCFAIRAPSRGAASEGSNGRPRTVYRDRTRRHLRLGGLRSKSNTICYVRKDEYAG